MRKTKKQLLGLVCLAAVALMTAFAISLPAPMASAAEDEAEPATGDVDVQVRVVASSPNCHIDTPSNDKTYVTNPIPIQVTCTKAISYRIAYKIGSNGVQRTLKTGGTQDEGYNYDYQVINTELALDNYTNDGTPIYVIAEATGNNGGGLLPTDTVAFHYRAVSTEVGPTDPETGNPSVDIDVDDTVEDLQICVYDKNGKPVFASKDDPENGCVSIKLDDIDKETGEFEVELPDGTVLKGTYNPETGEVNVEIPMDESGAGEGDYTVIVVGTDKDGNIVSMNKNDFTYSPTTPNLPNTGSIFGDLNISRADYLVTGLIAFGLVAGFAMVLIFRRNHRNN